MKSFGMAVAVFVFSFLHACSTAPKTVPATPPKGLFVLMTDPDGKVGEIVVSNEGGSQILAKPAHATEVKGAHVAPTVPLPMEENKIAGIFKPVLVRIPMGAPGQRIFLSPVVPLITLGGNFSLLTLFKYWREEQKVKTRTREIALTQDFTIRCLTSLIG